MLACGDMDAESSIANNNMRYFMAMQCTGYFG